MSLGPYQYRCGLVPHCPTFVIIDASGYIACMPRFTNALVITGFSFLLVFPSFTFAKEAKSAFHVQIMQGGKALKAEDGIIHVGRQEPFVIRAQAPARTAILVNVTGRNTKTPIIREENIHTNEVLPEHALISDGSEYLWYRLPEKGSNPRLTLRKRWTNQTIEGFRTLSGANWSLGTYILDEHLTFTFAAVPVDAKGKLKLSGKNSFSTIHAQLGTPSQEDDCKLMQNVYRNFGSENIPSCEELFPEQ